MEIRIADPADLGRAYDRILAASFPPNELVHRNELLESVVPGEALVGVDPAGELIAVAVGGYSQATGLMMLEYLAVDPGRRAAGAGSALLRSALAAWRERFQPGAFLAEIERPDAHRVTSEHGDPELRVAFYHRMCARALAVPYYQPAIRFDQLPVPDLLLATWVEDPSWIEGDQLVVADRLRRYLIDHNPQPTPGEAEAWPRLLQACDSPVPLVDLPDYLLVPRSGPLT